MRRDKLAFSLVLFLTVAACDSAKPIPAKRWNIEVTGSPQCLAEAAIEIEKYHHGITKLSSWKGEIGSMEFAAIDQDVVPVSMEKLKSLKCTKNVRLRKCKSATDLDYCGSPALSN